jgi:hypothetical protein
MTFISKKEQQATRKFELVRVNPARDITTLLTAIGGGVYTYASNLWVNRVELLGVGLTKVTGTPAIGEYSFNEFTKLLTVYPTTAPSSTNPLIAYHYLFFTGEIYRSWYEDPEDTNTELREWLPRLKNSPRVAQDVSDVLAGKLSMSITNIEIINDEWDLNEYFTINDSFYLKEVSIWLCLDDETNIQKLFLGVIVSATITREKISIDIKDNFQLLNNPCFVGDDDSEVYYQLSSNPLLDPNHTGEARPFILGTCSRYQTKNDSITNLPSAQKLDTETLPAAVCINFSRDLLVTNNRQWGICRTASSGFQDFTHAVVAVDNSDPNFTKFTSSSGNVAKIFIGDTFVMTITMVDYYGRVVDVDRVNNFIYSTPMAAATGTPTIQGNNCPSLVVSQDNNLFYLQYGRDYTATVTTTSSGNKLLNITLVNDFETPLAMTPLDPSSSTLYYRVRPSIVKHGAAIKMLLDKSGMPTNASSFTTADTDYPINVNFSIPNVYESDYENYIKYIEELLASTFGYIYLNNNFEFAYKLFTTPSSIDEITDGEMLKDSYSLQIEYQDIVTQIISYNPHCNSEEFVAKTGTNLKNIKAGYLHGFFNTTRFMHYLEDITTRLPDILNYRSNRSTRYIFETAVKNLDTQLGDDFLLSKSGLLDGETKAVKIISIDKYTLKTQVIATDLGA